MVPNLRWKFGPAEDPIYPPIAGDSDSEKEISSLDPKINKWDANGVNNKTTTFLFIVHVLNDLRYDVILRKDLLFDGKAFTAFEDYFLKNLPDILAELSVISDIDQEERKRLYSLSSRFNYVRPLCINADLSPAEELRIQRQLQAENANNITPTPSQTAAQTATTSAAASSNGSAATNPDPASQTSGQNQSSQSTRPSMPWKCVSRLSAARKLQRSAQP